jgi:hypothetical protein
MREVTKKKAKEYQEITVLHKKTEENVDLSVICCTFATD